MAKRSSVQVKSPESVKPAIDFDTVSTYNKVTVRSKIDGKYSCTCLSGNHYVWPCIGSAVDVDEIDVNELVSKHSGSKSCCGSISDDQNMFQIV